MIGTKIGSLKMLLLAGVVTLIPAVAQAQDSAKIIIVGGLTSPLSAPLPPNKDFTANATVQYSLSSLDAAILHVDVEEFQGSAGASTGCKGTVHSTNGGISAPIRRRSGNVMLKVTWNGSHPVYGAKTSYIGLFVTFSDPKSGKVILNTFPPQPAQCFAVGLRR